MTTSASMSAVIVNHRRYDLVEGCIAALQASSRPPDRIVVVDNDSEPGELAKAARAAPHTILVENADNRGYAAACNQGWRAASADLTLFLNADVTVDTDCLERSIQAILADPGVGIVTARLVRPDGSLDHACHRGSPTAATGLWYALRLHRLLPRSHRFAHYTMSWLDLGTDHDIEACTGAFLLIRSETLAQVGGWDEGYWFYGEDLDLCLRVRQAGYRVRYLAGAAAVHLKGASSHLHEADARLTPEQQATRQRVRRAIVDSHERYFDQHLAASTIAPVRWLVRMTFRLQRRRAA